MKAPRYFGGILDGWLAAGHLMPADCTSYLCKRNSILCKGCVVLACIHGLFCCPTKQQGVNLYHNHMAKLLQECVQRM